MSSRIEQLIDEIEAYIDNCKYKAFSTDVIMVNKAEIDKNKNSSLIPPTFGSPTIPSFII